jgi:chromate transport protein ChrA
MAASSSTTGWLTERQFLDAVAVAMITPGPVVITVAFIGFLVAGFGGASAAALGVFLPCYLFVVIPAPYFQRIADNRSIKAFVDGVSAVAAGATYDNCFMTAKRVQRLLYARAALDGVGADGRRPQGLTAAVLTTSSRPGRRPSGRRCRWRTPRRRSGW